MSVSTLIVRLAAILQKLADRDANRAVAKQAQFKKAAAARAKVIREERLRLERRAAELLSDEGQAKSQATLGDNKFNEQERAARTLSRQLTNIAG